MSSISMTRTAPPAAWAPASFVAQVHGLNRRAFLDDFGGTDFLLIRVRGASDPLSAGLALSCYALGNAPARSEAGVDGRTVDVGPGADAVDAQVPGLLVEEPHFMVAIQKRRGAEDESCVRLGRGRDCDIVLRDKSISKLHARIHLDQIGALSISDAGSHNHTFLNDARITERVEVAPGDQLRLGRVSAVVASAPQIWAMLHAQAVRT